LREFGEPHEEINPRDIVGYHPATDSRALRACFIPGEGSIHSRHMMGLLLTHLQRAPGVEIIDDEAQRVVIDARGRKTVTTERGSTLTAPQVVIACGTRSQQLIDQISPLRGRIPRMVFGIGTSILAETESHAPEKTIRTCNRGLACGVHVVPYDRV